MSNPREPTYKLAPDEENQEEIDEKPSKQELELLLEQKCEKMDEIVEKNSHDDDSPPPQWTKSYRQPYRPKVYVPPKWTGNHYCHAPTRRRPHADDTTIEEELVAILSNDTYTELKRRAAIEEEMVKKKRKKEMEIQRKSAYWIALGKAICSLSLDDFIDTLQQNEEPPEKEEELKQRGEQILQGIITFTKNLKALLGSDEELKRVREGSTIFETRKFPSLLGDVSCAAISDRMFGRKALERMNQLERNKEKGKEKSTPNEK